MKVVSVLPLSLSLLLAAGWSGAALSADSACTRLDQSASDAYTAGDYKKADNQWHKLLDRLQIALARSDESKSFNEQIETTLRHLGECALAQKNYDSADDYFKLAKSTGDSLQEKDADLDKDCKDLATNYRLIDLTNLGNLGIASTIVTAAISEFHPNKVSIAKLDSGHHVSVVLDGDVIKDIGAKGVTQVGVNKNMSFDLVQGEGGEITLSNISGIRVHAGFWVNIINSSMKLDESQRPVARVTAQKMGISQSVSVPVPDTIYQPVAGILAQVKVLFGDQPVVATPAITPSGLPAAGATATGAILPSGGIGLVPVTNTVEPTVSGTIVPIPPAQPQSGGIGLAPVTNTVEPTVSGTIVPIPQAQPQSGGIGLVPVTNTVDPTVSGATLPIPQAQPQSDLCGNYSSEAKDNKQPVPLAPAVQVPPAAPIGPGEATKSEHVN